MVCVDYSIVCCLWFFINCIFKVLVQLNFKYIIPNETQIRFHCFGGHVKLLLCSCTILLFVQIVIIVHKPFDCDVASFKHIYVRCCVNVTEFALCWHLADGNMNVSFENVYKLKFSFFQYTHAFKTYSS